MILHPEKKLKIFMLMPFEIGLEEIYRQYIETPITKLGHIIRRADDISSSTNILNDIIENIIKSDIIIADLTGKNPNVFYELGRAHQLKKWMIQIAKQGEDLPFDLKQIRTIFYNTDTLGREQLQNKVLEYIESFNQAKFIDNEIIELFNSESFKESISICEYLLENESDLSKDQLLRLAEVTQENNQLYKSYRVRDILRPLFTRQKGLLPKDLREKLEHFGWVDN